MCPLIIIYNNLKCSPGYFLMQMCPLKKKSKSLDPKEVKPFLIEEAKMRNNQFQSHIQQYYMQLVDWIIKMNSDSLRAMNRNEEREFLERRGNLIVMGINLAV
jgi:hypothetical protein